MATNESKLLAIREKVEDALIEFMQRRRSGLCTVTARVNFHEGGGITDAKVLVTAEEPVKITRE